MSNLTDDIEEIAEDTAKIVVTPVKVTISKIKDIVEYIFLRNW